jgi:hypothetical protein
MKPPTSRTLAQLLCGSCHEPMVVLSGANDGYCDNYHCGQYRVEWHHEVHSGIEFWAEVLQTPPPDGSESIFL